MKEIFLVMEGSEYPEGCPDGIFETPDDARSYIANNGSMNCFYTIYKYVLNKPGHEFFESIMYANPINKIKIEATI